MALLRTVDSDLAHTDIVLGTRKSELALIQCLSVQDALNRISPSLRVDVQTVLVKGDADKKTPFLLMGDDPSVTPVMRDQLAKSFWTQELETKLLSGHLDILVHCLKDIPTTLPSGTMIGAILEREDARDVLVVRKGLPYTSLKDLPDGAVVGTSSTRRKSLVRLLYPKLGVDECRGNVDSRIAKLDAPNGHLSCIIVAAAGLHRMGLKDRIVSYLPMKDFPYAAGQGALALQIRTQDRFAYSLVRQLDEPYTRWRCLAERSLLHSMQGGCLSPIGVWSFLYKEEVSSVSDNGWIPVKTMVMMRLGATVVHPHGWSEIRFDARTEIVTDADAEKLGITVAEQLQASGASELLEQVNELHQVGFRRHFAQKDELKAHIALLNDHDQIL